MSWVAACLKAVAVNCLVGECIAWKLARVVLALMLSLVVVVSVTVVPSTPKVFGMPRPTLMRCLLGNRIDELCIAQDVGGLVSL